MHVSVVIPVRNAAPFIRCQLEALSRQVWSGSWEVIVADNGSTDESLEMVEQYRDRLPSLRVVDASDRPGAAHARNVGVRAATAEKIMFCDADDEVAPGWLAAMAAALTRHDFVACWLDHKKLNPPWMDFVKNSQDEGILAKTEFAPFLPVAGGGTLGVKRKAHDAVGGFNESLHWHEDTDYCIRVQQAGFPLQIVSEALMYCRMRTGYWSIFRQSRNWAESTIALKVMYGYPVSLTDPKWWKLYARQWNYFMKVFPERLRAHQDRCLLMWELGWLVGRLYGFFKYRVPRPVQTVANSSAIPH